MTTTNSNQYQDTFIREVRATYHPTGTTPISIADPEQAAAFIRSVLSDNSREHFVALYLDGSHRITGVLCHLVGRGFRMSRSVMRSAPLATAVRSSAGGRDFSHASVDARSRLTTSGCCVDSSDVSEGSLATSKSCTVPPA